MVNNSLHELFKTNKKNYEQVKSLDYVSINYYTKWLSSWTSIYNDFEVPIIYIISLRVKEKCHMTKCLTWYTYIKTIRTDNEISVHYYVAIYGELWYINIDN